MIGVGFSIVFEFDLLEDHLRGVWSVCDEEVGKNEVCEELECASTVTDEPGFSRGASMEHTSNPALSKMISTLASFNVLT
jgi:hypothetical protein